MNKAANDLVIRLASENDAAAMSALLGELGFPSSASEVSARLQGLPSDALVAVLNGQVVGLVTTNVMPVLHRPTAVGRLSALVVSNGQRGNGVGRALVTAAEQMLFQRGCELVEVTSNLRLENAHAFYRHLGYEATSTRFKKGLVVAQQGIYGSLPTSRE